MVCLRPAGWQFRANGGFAEAAVSSERLFHRGGSFVRTTVFAEAAVSSERLFHRGGSFTRCIFYLLLL